MSCISDTPDKPKSTTEARGHGENQETGFLRGGACPERSRRVSPWIHALELISSPPTAAPYTLRHMLSRLIVLGSALAFASGLFAQTNPALPKHALGNGAQASATPTGPPDWSEPFPPHKMIGNIYYVGSRELASYLITTPAGHILINSNLKTSVPLIQQSIEKLGFHFSDVKILLISHAHFDHDGGSAEVIKLTAAKYMVMDGDVDVVESGGKSDFQYGDDRTLLYPPTTVDRVLHDGDEVRLGDTVLTAHKTAGHTRGCTTWSLKVREAGKTYDAVIVGSPNVNPGYKLVNNTRYREIADDYARGFGVLKSLPCDVFLGAHGSYYDLEAKYAKLKAGGANPYIDPEGYKNYVAEREQAFVSELQKQNAAAKKQ
jgi:metallo-beta-lactamase class B